MQMPTEASIIGANVSGLYEAGSPEAVLRGGMSLPFHGFEDDALDDGGAREPLPSL